jgi:predicted dehydrogenase
MAALTPGDTGPAHDGERAVLVDGASGTQTETSISPGDYRQFYSQLRDAVLGVAGNPVRPEQVIPVIAVLEAAIRSSAEGRSLTLPLTEAEVLGFKC